MWDSHRGGGRAAMIAAAARTGFGDVRGVAAVHTSGDGGAEQLVGEAAGPGDRLAQRRGAAAVEEVGRVEAGWQGEAAGSSPRSVSCR
jgi:hypothetical protein